MARKTMLHIPDMEGIDDSGGNFHINSGDYLMKCTGVSEETSKQDNPMYVFKFEGLEKHAKNRSFRMHCALTPKALWKLKQTLRALGVEIPEGSDGEFDPDDVVGVEVMGTVTDDEYEGKINSRLSEIRAVGDEVVDDDDDDKKTTTTAAAKLATGKTTKSKNGPPKVAASEIEDMNEDELIDINDRYDLGIDLDAHKTTTRKRNAIIAGLQASKQLEA